MPRVRRLGWRKSHLRSARPYDRLMGDTATSDRQVSPGRVSRLVHFPVTRILLTRVKARRLLRFDLLPAGLRNRQLREAVAVTNRYPNLTQRVEIARLEAAHQADSRLGEARREFRELTGVTVDGDRPGRARCRRGRCRGEQRGPERLSYSGRPRLDAPDM